MKIIEDYNTYETRKTACKRKAQKIETRETIKEKQNKEKRVKMFSIKFLLNFF